MDRALSVTELNNLVKMTLESSPHLYAVSVVGEVAAVTVYNHGKSSTWFTLKDTGCEISCVHWDASDIKQGDQIEVTGRVAVWTRRGRYQLVASKICRVGDGLEKERLEKLIAELEKKGYFDPRSKKALPAVIKKVALVTSVEGAAVGDVCGTLETRGSIAQVRIYDARVQGPEAAAQIADAIERINLSDDEADVIVLTRGGGGKEDLVVFNDAVCFEAVHNSRIPVICAIGHERDLSIAERCADKHCITPTDAAVEVALRSSRDMYFSFAGSVFLAVRQRVLSRISAAERELLGIRVLSPLERIVGRENAVSALQMRAKSLALGSVERRRALLENLELRIEAASPFKILDRGYALVYMDEGLATARGSKPGDRLSIMMRDGTITADVVEVQCEDLRRKIGRTQKD